MNLVKKLCSQAWHAFDGLAADTLWSGGSDLSMMVNAFVSITLLQLTFSQELLGNYFGLFGVLGVLGAFAHSGIGLSALQRILGEADDANDTLRSSLSLSAVIAIISILIAILAAGLRLKQLSILEIGVLAVAELVAAGIIAIAGSVIQGTSGFAAAARIRMGVIGVRFSTTTSLYLTGNLTIRNLALGFLVGLGAYAIWLLRVHLPRHGLVAFITRPSKKDATDGLSFSFPMAAGKVQTDGDKYLLNAFGFEAQAGLYGIAYRGMQVANAPLMALEAAAFQRFMPKEVGKKGVHWRRANRFTLLMFGASVILTAILFLALPVLEFVLFREDKKEAAEILPWLLGLIPMMAISGTPLNGLLGLGRVKERGYVFFTSALISVCFYLIFIPMYDWRGAVLATYISETILIVLGWWVLWHYQKVEDGRLDRELAAIVRRPSKI